MVTIKKAERLHYNIISQWYQLASVKFEMIKFMKYRESSFLVPSYMTSLYKHFNVRMLKIHSVQHLDIIRRALKIDTARKKMNLYYSLARYDGGIPNQSLALSKRDNEKWKNTHHNHINAYDFLLDIDSGNFIDLKWAYLSAKEIKKHFDLYDTPYELRFSGKGFHFIIPYSYFKHLNHNFIPHDDNSIYKFYSKFADTLHREFSEMTDKSIYDSRRLCKVPYSLAIYEDQYLICTPFKDDVEFDDFDIEDFKAENYKFVIRDRGTHIFNEYGSVDKVLKVWGLIK